jgi:hypothetical protein
MNNAWGVLVFDKNISDIGLGAKAYKNKSAILFQVGNYKLNYIIIQLLNGYCSFSTTYANNSTTSR